MVGYLGFYHFLLPFLLLFLPLIHLLLHPTSSPPPTAFPFSLFLLLSPFFSSFLPPLPPSPPSSSSFPSPSSYPPALLPSFPSCPLAIRHLLYARFMTHFLYDIGLVSVREPFQKLLTLVTKIYESVSRDSKKDFHD